MEEGLVGLCYSVQHGLVLNCSIFWFSHCVPRILGGGELTVEQYVILLALPVQMTGSGITQSCPLCNTGLCSYLLSGASRGQTAWDSVAKRSTWSYFLCSSVGMEYALHTEDPCFDSYNSQLKVLPEICFFHPELLPVKVDSTGLHGLMVYSVEDSFIYLWGEGLLLSSRAYIRLTESPTSSPQHLQLKGTQVEGDVEDCSLDRHCKAKVALSIKMGQRSGLRHKFVYSICIPPFKIHVW